MNDQKQNESESKQIKKLETEIITFEKEEKACEDKARELLASEDLRNGVCHHQEIFLLKQDKLRLQTEILFRTNKINRLRLV